MSWETPVYNRTVDSYYEFDYVNRVNNNTIFLRDLALEYFTNSLSLEFLPEYNIYTIPTEAHFNTIERNINTVKNVLYVEPLGWTALFADRTGYGFTYEDANNIEYNLDLLYNTFYRIIDSMVYSGTTYAGFVPGEIII